MTISRQIRCIPVVVMTAAPNVSEQELLDAGFVACLFKPMSDKDLINTAQLPAWLHGRAYTLHRPETLRGKVHHLSKNIIDKARCLDKQIQYIFLLPSWGINPQLDNTDAGTRRPQVRTHHLQVRTLPTPKN